MASDPFTGDEGNPGDGIYTIECAAGLQVNNSVSINGSTDLSTYITADDNGCVYGIQLTGDPGVYKYQVNVDCQGPSGFGSGSLYLAFTDASPDTYKLWIYSGKRGSHYVAFDSQKPAITKIQWSNKSF